MQLSHTLTATSAVFDEPNLVSCAGLVPAVALAESVGLRELADAHLSVPTDKGANAGLKAASLVAGMVAGADSIDDMALLRHGGMARLFAHAYAPSTLGSFLREFTFGHVRQLDAVASRFLAGLSEPTPLVAGTEEYALVDVDDSIIEVHGYAKAGAGFGYSGVRGLNAALATLSTPRAAPVVLTQRPRKGAAHSARGAKRLVADALSTLRGLACPLTTGRVLVRADSAFYGHASIGTALKAGADVSVTVPMNAQVRTAIAAIGENAWTPIEYPQAIFDEESGRWVSRAEVAETPFTAFSSQARRHQVPGRLVVRRIPELNPQAKDGQPDLLGRRAAGVRRDGGQRGGPGCRHHGHHQPEEAVPDREVRLRRDVPANRAGRSEQPVRDLPARHGGQGIGGRQVMLASYWDAGYVKVDVTDVHNPVYLGDTDFTDPDPEAAESGLTVPPEGNGHQAEFTSDKAYVIGAHEDFAPFALQARNVTDGTDIDASQGSDTKKLAPGETITGQAKFVGRACNTDATVPAGDGTQIAVVERGVCTFTDKVANVINAGGYEAVLIFNREGSDACNQTLGMSVDGDIPTFGVAPREQGFAIFGAEGQYDDAACLAGDGSRLAPIALGATGDTLTFSSYFDGWGYVHLFDNSDGKIELDTYAIPEAHDQAFADGFGDLSVHEVATSQQVPNRLYFSYYSGGFRVAEIEGEEIVEKGHYIDPTGNNFSGVQVFQRGTQEYVAASDRDSGLWIFKYTG